MLEMYLIVDKLMLYNNVYFLIKCITVIVIGCNLTVRPFYRF